MDKVTVELTHINALQLLKDLEKMDIIRIENGSDDETPFNNESNSSKLRGKLSAESATALRNHVKQSREEWEERFPSNL